MILTPLLLGMRRGLALIAALAAVISSSMPRPVLAQAQSFPLQRPGTVGLGNVRLSVFAVYNSQFTENSAAGAVRPRSPFGKGFTPIGGYIYSRGQGIVYVDDSGFETAFTNNGNSFRSEHRVRGDLTEIVKLPNGYRVIDEGDNSKTYEHIYEGRAYLTSVRDAEQRLLAMVTWRNGIPLSVRATGGGETIFSADSRGLITGVRAPEGLSYQLTYSPNDELVEVKAGSTKYLTLGYDSEGNVREITDVQGEQTFFEYERGGRLKMARGVSATTTYTYDITSITAETTDANGVFFAKRSFKPVGKLLLPISEERGYNAAALGGIKTFSIQRDSNGNVTSMSDEMGGVTSFSRDVDGLSTKIVFSDKSAVKIERDKGNKSRITSMTKLAPTGATLSTTVTSWDKFRVLSTSTTDSKNRPLAASTITRNGNSRSLATREATYYTYSPKGPKGIVTGQVSYKGSNSINFDAYGLPTSYTSDGVTVSIAARLNRDGSTSTVLSSSVFGETRQSNFLGTSAEQTMGNPTGTFLTRNSSEGTFRALSGSSVYSSVTTSGSARAGVSVSESYEVLPTGEAQRDRRVTFSGKEG